jgi:hypothetical protein
VTGDLTRPTELASPLADPAGGGGAQVRLHAVGATQDRLGAHRRPRTRGFLLTLAGSTAVACVAAVAVLTSDISDASAGQGRATAPSIITGTTSATPEPATPAVDQRRVLAEIHAAAAAAGGSIQVVVVGADGRPLLTGPDTATATYTASLVKILVAARLLTLDAAGYLSLSGDDLALMQRAVEQSDDDAMNTLWGRYDGAQLVTDAAMSARLAGTSPPAAPGQWGQTMTTAVDVAAFLTRVGDILGPSDAATLLGWMRSASAAAADGFDQRFGLLADGSGRVAAKQGWMCCLDGRRYLHSAGVLQDGRAMVLLGVFPQSTSWDQAAAALDTASASGRAGTDMTA